MLEPEISGLFVAPGDIDGLAAAPSRVIDDDSLRFLLGAARRRYREKFDVRQYAERLGQLHTALLLGRGQIATSAEQHSTR